MWIDDAYKADTKSVTVKAQSEAYFRILEKHPEMKDVFRLGNFVVWISPSGTALVIDQNDGKEKLDGRGDRRRCSRRSESQRHGELRVNSRKPARELLRGGLLFVSRSLTHDRPSPQPPCVPRRLRGRCRRRSSSSQPRRRRSRTSARLQARRAELHLPQLRPRTGPQADEGTRPQVRASSTRSTSRPTASPEKLKAHPRRCARSTRSRRSGFGVSGLHQEPRREQEALRLRQGASA